MDKRVEPVAPATVADVGLVPAELLAFTVTLNVELQGMGVSKKVASVQ